MATIAALLREASSEIGSESARIDAELLLGAIAAQVAPTASPYYHHGESARLARTPAVLPDDPAGDRIVGRESPAKWGFGFIDELWADPEAIRARLRRRGRSPTQPGPIANCALSRS